MSGIKERVPEEFRDAGVKKPGITQTGILFSITIILFIFTGYRVQRANFYSGVLITEFGLILLPALLFLLLFRYDLRSVLRLNGTRPVNFLVTFVLMLFAIPVAGVFNFINLFLVNSIFGKIIVNQPPVAGNARELLVNILVIAGSAGLCEEFLFRGVIQRGFERFGTVRSILLAAFLFSLTHLDFQKIFGTFLLGALIGFIVYRTDSLFCGMFAHFTNNAVAVLLSFLSVKFMSAFQGSGVRVSEESNLNDLFSMFGRLSPQQLMAVLFVYGFLFLFIISMFILLLYALLKLNPVSRANRIDLADTAGYDITEAAGTEMTATKRTGAVKGNATGLLWLLPGVFLIACIYYFEVYRFTGAENGLIEGARRLLGI